MFFGMWYKINDRILKKYVIIKRKEKKKLDYETIENTSIKEDLRVDIYNLHIEAQLYPALVEKWGTRLAEAKEEIKQAKDKLDMVYADLDFKIRNDPDEYEVKKVTNETVKSAIMRETEHQQANENYLKACKNVDIIQVACNTIDAKKSTIKHEVELYIAGYFSDPKIPKEFKQQEKEKTVNETRERIKQRKQIKGGE